MKYCWPLGAILLYHSCKSQQGIDTCFIGNGSDLDKTGEIVLPNGKVRQTNTGVHDTLAIDLLIVVKDQRGRPVKDVEVEIVSVKTGKTDAKGKVSFIAFYNGPGIFRLKIRLPSYGCFEIADLEFRSGFIRWLEIIFQK